mgnify:CR=1 FL=1
MTLEKLLAPGRIGSMELDNRLVFAPIAARGAGPEGTLSPALARFYEERAKGGMGLVIMGATRIFLLWRSWCAGCTPAGQGLPWNSAGAAPEDRMAIPSLLRPFDLPLNPSLREKYRSK